MAPVSSVIRESDGSDPVLYLPGRLPVELWSRIIDQLPVRGMFHLASANRFFRDLVFIQLRSNVRARYRAFISDVDELEDIMERTCSVVFGSFVASLVSGAPHWEPQNIDFIVQGGMRSIALFANFLRFHEYAETFIPFEPSTMVTDSLSAGYNVRRIFHRSSDNAQITLLNCTNTSTAHVLLNSYSTLSFQFLTSKYLCCAYPFLTLFDNAIVNPLTQHYSLTNILWERYDKRGWDHWTYATDPASYAKGINKWFLCPHLPRFIGDSGCLVMPLTREDAWTPRWEFMNEHGRLWDYGLEWMVGGTRCPLRCGSRKEMVAKGCYGHISPDLTSIPF